MIRRHNISEDTISAELKVLRDMPTKYSYIANQVDLAMKHGDKPCIGNECDLDSPCTRHERTIDVVNRYMRMKKRVRLCQKSG